MRFLFLHIVLLLFTEILFAQNNAFYSNGATIRVTSGAEVHVFGDVHMIGGTLTNDGLIQTRRNSYSNTSFQQRGTGTYRIDNSDYNQGNRQFIAGSFAVRGGQSAIGVNDGSFYNLELNNDQGIVYLLGFGNIADVRNSVNFQPSTIQNRIITHNVGETGAITYPTNGSGYNAVFGLMNPTPGLGSLINNTAAVNGNMSGIDAGYIQGKFRRAIATTGGNYEFIVGLEPAGTGAQRGFQLARASIGVNTFDFISSYFFTGFDNSFALDWDCNGYGIDYFGGTDAGAWYMEGFSDNGTGDFDITVWPQDDNMTAHAVWVVTRDYQLDGTTDVCGPSPFGLTRTGFQDYADLGYFSLAAGDVYALNIDIQLEAKVENRSIVLDWEASTDYDYLVLERSTDAHDFQAIYYPSGESSYIDSEVLDNVIYYYRIKGLNVNNEVTGSSAIRFAKITSTDLAGQVDLFPNPVKEELSIRFNNLDTALSWSITNAFGQIIYQPENNSPVGSTIMHIETNSWARGVYFLQLLKTQTNEQEVIRIIKN